MKQIFSWTIGSFFRTIGRTLALLGMGALLYFILSRLGVGITDLFFDNVKAETFTTSVVYTGTGYFSSSGTNVISDDVFYKITISNSNNIQRITIPISGIDQSANKDYVQFNLLYGQPNGQVFSYTYDTYQDYCDRWNWRTIDSFNNVISWGCDRVHTTTNTETGKYYKNQILSGMEIYAYVDFETSGYANCSRNEDNLFICPTEHKKISAINFLINFPSSYTAQFQLALNRVVAFYNLDNSVSNAINNNTNAITNQTQQQQQQHQEIMDNNSTATDQKANSFFNNSAFEDTGGLSSIITAPLSMINSMLNNTYSMPCATWKGSEICLPGGDLLWSRPGASDLKNLLNVFYGGFVCYYAIRKLFLMIERMKDPSSDNIEVTDL